ncbi:DNA topoisomerase 2-associated protein pat1 [Schizosaccharomyces pombe]
MSFFGFNTTLPKENMFPNEGQLEEDGIDFEETYDDLGNQLNEAGDELNDETFGVSAGSIGRDFDFSGTTAQASAQLEDEQYQINQQNVFAKPVKPASSELPQVSRLNGVPSREPASTAINKLSDLQPMASIWENIVPEKPAIIPPEVASLQDRLGAQPSEKVFSLQELEEQLLNSMTAPKPPSQPAIPIVPSEMAAQVTRENISSLDPAISAASIGNVTFGQPNIPSTTTDFAGLAAPNMVHPSQAIPNPVMQPSLVPQMPYPQNGMYNPSVAPPASLVNLFQQEQLIQNQNLDEKRQKLERDHMLMTQCAGLMTRSDKSFIARIQISQLMSEDPESDDFYYRVYSIIRGRKPSEEEASHFIKTYLGPSNNRRRGRRSENPMQKLQQQLQRLVSSAKERPKATQLSLEGALGKIAVNTVRTPRQLLNVKRPTELASSNSSLNNFSGFSTKKDVLHAIEKVYDLLLDFEQALRKASTLETTDQEQIDTWKTTLSEKLESIWKALYINESLEASSKTRPPFISIISHPKGMRLLPRLFPHLSKEQQISILKVVVYNFDSLDIVLRGTFDVNGELPLDVVSEMSSFTQFIIPPLLTIVNELDLETINNLFSQLLNRTNAVYLIQTKIGLSFLTLFISRAEILKQSGTVNQNEKEEWENTFNVMFNRVKGHFSTVFPPPNARAYADESYPWEFLAACATAASSEQHFTLVSETRDRVLDNIITSKRAPSEIAVVRISNVNLFLNAMGLDARQLSA